MVESPVPVPVPVPRASGPYYGTATKMPLAMRPLRKSYI